MATNIQNTNAAELAALLILGMPLIKWEIESKLSLQERQVIAVMRHFDIPVPPREVSKLSRIQQHNHVSAILGRLVKKGFVDKSKRGFELRSRYRDWLRERCGYK